MREGHAKLAREWGEWSDSAVKPEAVAEDVGRAAEAQSDATADDLAAGVAGVKLDDAPATPSKMLREEPARRSTTPADEAVAPASAAAESEKSPAVADKRAAL